MKNSNLLKYVQLVAEVKSPDRLYHDDKYLETILA